MNYINPSNISGMLYFLMGPLELNHTTLEVVMLVVSLNCNNKSSATWVNHKFSNLNRCGIEVGWRFMCHKIMTPSIFHNGSVPLMLKYPTSWCSTSWWPSSAGGIRSWIACWAWGCTETLSLDSRSMDLNMSIEMNFIWACALACIPLSGTQICTNAGRQEPPEGRVWGAGPWAHIILLHLKFSHF